MIGPFAPPCCIHRRSVNAGKGGISPLFWSFFFCFVGLLLLAYVRSHVASVWFPIRVDYTIQYRAIAGKQTTNGRCGGRGEEEKKKKAAIIW